MVVANTEHKIKLQKMEEEEEEISRDLISWGFVWFSVMSRSVNLMILGSCCRSTEDGGGRAPKNFTHIPGK